MPGSNIFNNFRIGKLKLQHERQGVSKPTNDNRNQSRFDRADPDSRFVNSRNNDDHVRMGSSKSKQQPKALVDKNTGDTDPDQSGGYSWVDKRNSRLDSHYLNAPSYSPHNRAKSAPGVAWVEPRSPSAPDRLREPYGMNRTHSRLFEDDERRYSSFSRNPRYDDDGGRRSSISRRSPLFDEDNGRHSALSRKSLHYNDYGKN